MDASEVRQIFLTRLGLRLGPETSSYVLARLQAGQTSAIPLDAFPVMGGNARTGQPVREVVNLPALFGAAAATTSPRR